ncbi:MAG: Ig-like domain repeat protein [Clostridiales bacterium]|nr:Ig-like domain repeat protein [Clostridiales bacterium]
MKKRVLSLFLALTLCLTLLPTAAFAEGTNGSAISSEAAAAEGGQPTATGAPTEGGGQLTNTGEGEQPNSETDALTEIWCVSKPDSIARSYDGTTDGSTILIDLTFTDGTNSIILKEGTDFTAKKTFDSADAGSRTVTVEIELIGDAAAKYKLKAGEETFTISGTINKAYPDLTVSLTKTTCTVGEKLLPLLFISGVQEDAAVTYYYTQYQTIVGNSEYEGYIIPAIDENTAVSSLDEEGNNTYYIYAKTGETRNYNENISNVVELTVNEAAVEAASITRADGTDGGTYGSLPAALDAAQDGDTVTMLTTLNDDDTISFCRDAEGEPVEKTVTLMMNGQSLSFEGASPLHIQSGKLIIGDDAAISQPAQAAVPAVFVDNNEQSKDRGTLEFKGKATLTGGLLIQNWGKLVGGLKEGTIITSNGTYSVSVERSIDTYSNVLGLLGEGLAFAKKDKPTELINGNVKNLTEDVIVVAHTHSPKCTQNPDPDALQTYIYTCDCGFVCPHDRFTNSICDICHAACTHDEYTSDDKCARCGAPFAVRVECTDSVGITSNKLYMKTTTQDGTDDTLRQVFNEAADGSTITLLANGMLPYGIYASKTLTLDLNGHSLSGFSLNVGGSTATGQTRTGNLTVIDSRGGNGAVGVTVRDGGTLVFDPENDSTTLLQLEVWGGKVELHGGKILRKGLRLNNSITLGDLLPQEAGLAYYCGDTQLTLKEAASKTCDLVVKSCAHGGRNGFDETATACPYCGAPAVAETALNNGEGSCLQRRFANLQTAIDADRDGGATLQLLADVTGNYTIDGTRDTGLDLNGHCIKGTVTVKAAAGSNTTTFSNTKNITTASIDAVVAHRGAKLAGSKYPAVIGKLTLADTTQWKDILQQPTRLGFRVTNADGTHQWYAPNDVKDSQLNNVIINSLPITSKTLNLKVDGKNLTGSSPKVERGTTVQLCASCNAKGATVTFSILKTGETTPITLTEPSYAGGKYTKDYSFDTIGEYTIYFTAAKDGYSVTSSHKQLTVTKPNLSNAEITFRSSNESTYEPYRATTTAPGFTITYNGKTLNLGVDYTASGTASSAGVSTQTLTIKAVEGSDYTGSKTAEWRIVPHKAKVEVGDVIKAYDGTTDLPDDKISLVSAAGSAGYQAGLPLPLSEGNGFELTDAKYDSANASETEKNISFTVKLTDTNYTFEDGTTEKAFTLNGAELDDKSFKIHPATVTPAEITLFVYNDVAKTYTLDLATLLPELTSGCEYGKIKYQGCDYHFTDSTYLDSDNGMFVSNEGILTLPIVAAHSADVNKQIGTITAPVVTANYQQFELTIKVVIGEKITPVQSDDFKISATGIIYRQTLENSTLTVKGTMKDPTTGEAVPGTFAWLNKYDRPINTGDVYFDWTFTPAEGYEEYAAVTGIVKVPVAPKSINGAAITLEAASLEYNAAEQSPKITGVTLDNWDETRITYIIKSGDKATDVSDSITLTIEGTGNYTGTATVEWKITPKTVTPTMEVASCTYTGNALEPDVTLKDGDAVIPEGEYTAEYSNNTNAGTGRVAIKDVEGGNYIIASISRDFPIDQAAAPTNIQYGTLSVINGTQRTYTYDFQQLLPAAPHGDYGTVRYDLGNRQTAIHFTAHGYCIDPEIAEFEGSKLTLVGLYAKDATATGQIGTATVKVTTTNYKDFKLTLVLNAVNQITPVADGSITASKITYGQTLSESRISGTMKDPTTGAAVEGTFSWQLPDDTILDASTLGHDVGWTFTPKDGNTYAEVTGTATVKVDKAQQYGKVSMVFYIYGETPSTPSLTDRTGDGSVTYYYNTTNSNSGGIKWENIQPDTLNAGTRYYMYAELGETENYDSFTTACKMFWVMKAIPTCTKPTGLTAKYGQKLSQIALPNPEGNTPGTWRWQEPETVLDQLGTRSFYADFKPDNENYSEVLNVAIDVTVGPADGGSLKTVELVQKYTDTSEHTYTPDWSELPGGQTWRYNSEYSVSTGSNVTLTKRDLAVDGRLLTYAISGGKAGDKITLTLKASCDNYKDFTITLNITLTEKDDQKPLTITGNTSVIYGEKLTLTTSGGNGTGAVTYRIDNAISTGEAAIDPNTGVLTPVKVGSVSVVATKAGDNDYNDVTSAPFVLMIKPATPTGEPNYTKITTGGKTLKDAALTIEGSTLKPNDGKLEWVDDKGNVLPDNTRVKVNTTYKWRFTPTDTNYTTLTGEIELLHHKSNGGGSSGYSCYTIEATAGAGGSISPSGSVSVREGGDQTFTITPDKGYAVSTVKIDGKSIGAVKSYTFENVSRTHTIEVIFVKGTASARTGDSSDLPLWSALLLASTLTLAGAVHYKRKRAR